MCDCEYKICKLNNNLSIVATEILPAILPFEGQRREADEFENNVQRYEQPVGDRGVDGNAQFANWMIVVEKVQRFLGGKSVESWCAERLRDPNHDLFRRDPRYPRH